MQRRWWVKVFAPRSQCTLEIVSTEEATFNFRYNFGNFFSDAESADISALDADDFTDVTLAKVTLLM